MGNNVVIAIPAYSGTVEIGTMRSLIADTLSLIQRGDVVSIYDEAHGAEIDSVRAQIVAEFLSRPKATHLIMIDSDLVWEAGGLLKLIDATKNAGCEIIGGVYPYRRDPITRPLYLHEDNKELHNDETGYPYVRAVAGGFVCVTRRALEQMTAEYRALTYNCPKTNRLTVALFDHVWENGRRLSEDLSFCARWRKMGGRVYLDPDIRIGHIGPKVFDQ